MKMKLPKDQFLSTVRVGDKGQIVITKEVGTCSRSSRGTACC